MSAPPKKGDYKKTPLLMDDTDVIEASESYNNAEHERRVLPFPESDEFVKVANETAKFPPNIIVTTRYTVLSFFPKSLFEQFRRLANVYFLVLGCIAAIGSNTQYYDTAVEPAGLLVPLTIVVLISVAKDGVEDFKRHQADNRTNNRTTRIVHSDGSVHEAAWKDIEVGSVLLLFNDDEVPADGIILDSGGLQGNTAYVETAAIDGETNLKVRFPGIPQCSTGSPHEHHSLSYDKSTNTVSGLSKVKTMFHVEQPNGSIHNFNGSMECEYRDGTSQDVVRSEITMSEKNICLRGSTIRACEWVLCVVVYTGKDTKLSRNSKSPPSKLSVVDSVVNRTLVIAIGCMVVVCCLSTIFALYWRRANNDADYLCLHEGDMDDRYTSNTGCENGATNSILLILTFTTLYNNFVAISMYVSLEMIYLWQAYFISQDLSIYDPASDSPAESHTSGMCADLGQVQYVLSDKTGTLTKNVMRLRRCSVAGMLYGAPSDVPEEKNSNASEKSFSDNKASFSDSVLTTDQGLWSPLSSLGKYRFLPPSDDNSILNDFMRTLAVCNTVMLMPNMSTGKMDISDADSLKECLEAESPDEVALVLGAAEANVVLVKRDSEIAQVTGRGEPVETIKILAVNEFDSRRRRMSIIVRIAASISDKKSDEKSGAAEENDVGESIEWGPPILFCKGADTAMFSSCKGESYVETCKIHVDEFACTGLRTLVMAKRELSEEEFSNWFERYKVAAKSLSCRKDMLRRCAEDIEVEMSLLGAVGIEDELQDGVPECIDLISRAGMNMWMITGDKPETAIAIGRMCGLLRPDHELEMMVKVSSGETLRHRLAELLHYFERKKQLSEESGEGSSNVWNSILTSKLFSWAMTDNNDKNRFEALLIFHVNVFTFVSRQGKPNADIESTPQADSTDEDSHDQGKKRDSTISFTRLSFAASKSPKGRESLISESNKSEGVNPFTHHDSHRESRAEGDYTRHSLSTNLALIIDGHTLEDIWNDEKALEMFSLLVRDMSTVIACRVSPLQKSSLVRMVKRGEGKPVTLAIGDGANDIGMINEAKVGVGICGNEGRHAANSADFAIGQFRFLAPLILKHGRYNYMRCAKLVLYCFFKNLVLVSSLFYYCVYSGFSGMMPLDSIIFSGFNFYLGLPILCVGVFDVDVPYEVVVKHPFLAHATGKGREMLNMWTMLRWCLLAFAEGLVLFSLAVRVIGGSTKPESPETSGYSLQGVGLIDSDGKAGGIFAEGFLLYCCVIVAMVYKVCAMTNLWNIFHVVSHVSSMAGFLLFVYVYSLIEEIPDWYHVTEFTLNLPSFWLAILMVPICISMMDCFVEWSFAQLFPASHNKLEALSRGQSDNRGGCHRRSQDSSYSVDERKSTKSIKLTPTSSDNEGEFAY